MNILVIMNMNGCLKKTFDFETQGFLSERKRLASVKVIKPSIGVNAMPVTDGLHHFPIEGMTC